MSYRPENQALTEPIEKILEGIEQFSMAVHERIKSDEWKRDHIYFLMDIRAKLHLLEPILREVKRETW
jgi:hypothetical protein